MACSTWILKKWSRAQFRLIFKFNSCKLHWFLNLSRACSTWFLSLSRALFWNVNFKFKSCLVSLDFTKWEKVRVCSTPLDLVPFFKSRQPCEIIGYKRRTSSDILYNDQKAGNNNGLFREGHWGWISSFKESWGCISATDGHTFLFVKRKVKSPKIGLIIGGYISIYMRTKTEPTKDDEEDSM